MTWGGFNFTMKLHQNTVEQTERECSTVRRPRSTFRFWKYSSQSIEWYREWGWKSRWGFNQRAFFRYWFLPLSLEDLYNLIWITDLFFSRIVITVSHKGSKQPEISTKKVSSTSTAASEWAIERTIECSGVHEQSYDSRAGERAVRLTIRFTAVLNKCTYAADRMPNWKSKIYELTKRRYCCCCCCSSSCCSCTVRLVQKRPNWRLAYLLY